MKKFTRNFLLVEHGFGNVLRKIGLSMVAILMAVAVYAQPQDTYHVFAEDVEDCYRGDNNYAVSVSMRDFVEIDSFTLVLTYDDDIFNYKNVTNVRTALTVGSGLDITEVSLAGDNKLVMTWDSGDTPQTVEPNNDTLQFFVLNFELKGFPHAEGSLLNYQTDLAWIQAESSVWNWESGTQASEILTWNYTDGSIDVTQQWADVVVETTAADCDGGQAIATVVSPTDEDMEYSWNGNTFTSNASTTINNAPTTGTVRVRLDGCVSYTDTFSVAAAPAFSFDVEETTIEVDCPGGDGDLEIEALGGDGNYTYFVVSDADFANVIADFGGKSNNEAIAYLIDDNYDTSNPVVQLPEGKYHVMVVDGNHCQDVRIQGDWIEVDVEDNKTPWSVAATVVDEQCHEFENGAMSFDISGATPFADGYTVIAPAGVTVDSPASSVSLTDLAPGAYEFTFVDSLSCRYDTTIVVDPANEIEFDIVYNDASCGDSTGWIALTGDIVNSVGDTLSLSAADAAGYTFVLSNVPDFSALVGEWPVNETADSLLADVYYLRVYQDGYSVDACYEDYENENEDNAIKLLSVDVTAYMDDIYCGGDSAATAWITIANAPSGDPGIYKYAVDYINSTATEVFVPVDSVLTGPGGTVDGFEGDTTYIFTVWDTVTDCSFTIPYFLDEPDVLDIQVVDELTYEPTCHGANDGDIQVQGSGGTTFSGYSYEYKFDDRPWDTGGISNVFAADTGMHVIYIRDAVGCIDSVEFNLQLTPNVIDVFEVDAWFDASTLAGYDANTVDADTVWLTCNSDTTWLFADSISWIHEPAGTNQGEREPKMYWGTSTDDISTLLTDSTNAFTAGTYYFQGRDEWGCVSNVDTFVVWEPLPLVAEASWYADAGCEGTYSGVIKIEAWNQDSTDVWGNPTHSPRYQYAFTESAAIMQQSDWNAQVNWIDFHNDDTDNDSVVFVRNLPEGDYYVAVRYVCAMDNHPEYREDWYYKTMEPIHIDQIDAIDIDWDLVTIETITCDVEGDDPAMDASVTGLLDALEGGTGGFEFTLDLVTAYDRYDADDLPDFPMTNMSGNFTGLPAGDYTLMVEDSTGCTYMEYFSIESDVFSVDAEVIYASCNDSHDGIMRFIIEGGVAPFEETTNNVGMYEDVNDIPAIRWNDIDSTNIDENDMLFFERLAQAGTYETYVRDANGCVFKLETVVEEPEEFTMVVDSLIEPTCAVADQASEGSFGDGEIWLEIGGGWASDEDNFEYIVTIGTKADTVDYGEIAKFTGLGSGTYTVKVTERNDTLAAMPIFKYSDYIESWDTISKPYQNPDTACYTTFTVELDGPDPLDYVDIEYTDEQCYNTPTGKIYLYGISGGVQPYTVWVEGPNTYRPGTGGVGEQILLEDEDGVNLTEYTWDDLVRGHYTIYVEDSVGCVLVEESGEIGRPDSLEITNTELIENALCNDGNGIVEIHAEGGVAPYMYALGRSEVPNDGEHPVPHDDLNWQASSTFEVPADTYIAWVMDSLGCVTGYASENGVVLTQHRVTVREPDPIEIDVAETDDALCYGAENGAINVDAIYGGNGPAWTVVVSGTTYDGTAVNKTYLDVASANAVLDSLYASTTKTRDSVLTAEDYYWITVYDDEGCESSVDSAAVFQPEEFVVDLIANTDAFVCPDDLAGVFEMQVLSGGTPFGGIEGRFEFKWQAYADAEMTELVRETDWGFTKEFQGNGNRYYYVQARDVNGCVTDTMKFIDGPDPIEYDIDKISCYGDSMASARVTAEGTEGRSLRVWYKQIEGDHATLGWMTDSVWFDEGYHDMEQQFIFDDDDLTDSRYVFRIEDELGCLSEIDTLAFDPIQTPLVLTVDMGDEGECSSEVVLSATGGMPPYEFHVMSETDTIVVAEGAQWLEAGTYSIKVADSNFRCDDMVSDVVVETNPVVRDTLVETYIGYETQFVDTEAGVDTMLAEGDYTFTYMVDDCERTLNVEVVAVPRDATIATVQSEGDESEWVGDTVQVTGTVTAVAEGEGFFMQDANTAWSGIWVAYTTTADMEIGDGVTVVGEVAEVANVTTIVAETVEDATAPVVVDAIPVEPMDAENEMYESVLVMVEGARAMAEDTTNGEWVVYTETDNDVVINDWLFAYAPTEGNFYDVTGVVNGNLDIYKVEPRMESDVVDLSDPAVSVDPELDAVEFKVYPNPFDNHIKIDNNDKLTRVVISNIAGQRVMDVEYPSHEIRTARLVSGVYVVSMFTEDGLAKTERIVKGR